jgi:hypothetical protein
MFAGVLRPIRQLTGSNSVGKRIANNSQEREVLAAEASAGRTGRCAKGV